MPNTNRLVIGIFLAFTISDVASSGCREKYSALPNHSACLPKAPNAKSGFVKPKDALESHNKYRSLTQQKYKATNMLKMVWDDEVAMVAQKWSENCNLNHDSWNQRIIPGRFSVGQNLAHGPDPLTWDTVVELFYNESQKFSLGSGSNVLTDVGHFTQLAWATSYILGCGYTICSNVPGQQDKTIHFYVCNYAPSGNHKGELGQPFKNTGAPKCKKTEKGLCDCGNVKCEMDSVLDPMTCTCQCTKSSFNGKLDFIVGTQCNLNCTDIKEPSYCGTQFDKSKCSKLTNVPFQCPHTCSVCPYADANYHKHDNGDSRNGVFKLFYLLSLLVGITFVR